MGRDLGLDGVVEHFTLDEGELALLRNKTGATRLGFTAMLKFLLFKGRFPRGRFELPDDAVDHLARQAKVPVGDIGFYDFTGRTAKAHRKEIREATGFRICTVADQKTLAAWLAVHIAQEERRTEQVRAQLLAHCRKERIEPPTAERVARVVDSGIRQADERLISTVEARLPAEPAAALEALLTPADDEDRDEPVAAGEEAAQEPDVDVLSAIKASPGNASLATMVSEIAKLEAVRAIGLPGGVFAGIHPKVVSAWRARAAVESPSHLRDHPRPVRLVLLAALAHQRERELTDTLVDLLNSIVHKINARAEKKLTEEFAKRYKEIRNKRALLNRIAEVSLEAPRELVEDAIYPVLGGTSGIADLLHEYKCKRGGYARDKQRVFKSSYSGHYRTGLIGLLRVLDFRSNNNDHRPVLDGLELILAHADAKTTYYPSGTHVRLDKVVKAEWREFALDTDPKGKQRVVRLVYECCVLQALRDCLRCKEIWVVGADRWRNPDEDLPADFDAKREENYAKLDLPHQALEYTEAVRMEMREELGKLHSALPKLRWLEISEKNLGGAIKLTPLEPLLEPKNLRRLKKYIEQRWGTTPLIEFLKEAVLRTGVLTELTGVGTRSGLDPAVLAERLLLCTYGYGTNSGLRAVASGDHPHTEEDVRYTARRYLTPTGLKAMAVAIANATFAARQETVWGQGTTTVASDSTHFAAWDRNIFTEWHSRYRRSRGILVYWHIEKGRMVIHSKILTCSASEVAAAIEGVMRHGTAMNVAGNYVDSHGQSEIGFGVTKLLGYQLLPRIKQINKAKLYRPGPTNGTDPYPGLAPAMTRPIKWDLIEQNYDMLVRYATAIRVGTASTEAILRRFTRNASHHVYQAMLELGRAQKTIFICQYLRDRELQREINSGLNVVEGWNDVNDVIFFGKSGELSSNHRDQHELAIGSLHVLQAALVYINTLMIQDALAEPEWADVLAPEDRRGLNPLFTTHMTPYGEVKLNMSSRLSLSDTTTPAPPAGSPEADGDNE